MRQERTLAYWLKSATVVPITNHAPAVGIHDTREIDHTRTFLWDLSDYYVSSVQAGVIWLSPRDAKKQN